MNHWDLSDVNESALRRKPAKPILKKQNKLEQKIANVNHVLERPRKQIKNEKPTLRNKPKENIDLAKTDKSLKKGNRPLTLPNSDQIVTKKEKRRARESFAQRSKKLRLERLKAEARSNYHRKIPPPIRPFYNSRLDNEPSVYQAVMDERRAEGMGYGGAR